MAFTAEDILNGYYNALSNRPPNRSDTPQSKEVQSRVTTDNPLPNWKSLELNKDPSKKGKYQVGY